MGYQHPSVAGGGSVDIGLVDDEEDLWNGALAFLQKVVCRMLSNCIFQPRRGTGVRLEWYLSEKGHGLHTFLGLRRVTRVIPGTCFRPSFPMAFLAFFSLRE